MTQAVFAFVLPSSFRPGEFLRSPRLAHLHDDARYFMSTVLMKTARGQVDNLGLVRLHARYLRKVMSYDRYARVIDALIERDAVERFPYTVGERSFGYRLGTGFVADKHVRVPVRDPRLIQRLQVFHNAAEADRKSRLLPVHVALDKQQRQLQIKGDEAREIIAALRPESNPYDTQGILISDIERRDFHTNVGRYGRVTNNITSMKREVRTALHVQGQRLASVDLCCAQPAFLSKLTRDEQQKNRDRNRNREDKTKDKGREAAGTSINDAGRSSPGLANLTEFETLACTGRLYDFLIGELSKRGMSIARDVVKRKFLADVLAKKKANKFGAEYPSLVEECFAELFPFVYRFIREFNRQGWHHERLIRALQREESKFVIEQVGADLVAKCPSAFFLTLHDAIYSTPQYVPKVEEAFKSAFERNGFRMSYKVDRGEVQA